MDVDFRADIAPEKLLLLLWNKFPPFDLINTFNKRLRRCCCYYRDQQSSLTKISQALFRAGI